MTPKKKAATPEATAPEAPLVAAAQGRIEAIEALAEHPEGKTVRVINLETEAVSSMDVYRAREHVTAAVPKYAYAPPESPEAT